jgi:hypothetical protein
MPSSPQVDVDRLSADVWLRLGALLSEADHIARILLDPAHLLDADRASVTRGALASLRLAGVSSDPGLRPLAVGARWFRPAPADLTPEASVIIDACYAIGRRDIELLPVLTPTAVLALNGRVATHGDENWSTAAKRMSTRRQVASLAELCTWLNGPVAQFADESEEMVFAGAIMKACCAHLALVDQGRFPWVSECTARLVEFGLLVQSGALPFRLAPVACEHYGQTAEQYRREVHDALQSGRPERFIEYAVGGIVEGMWRQLDEELQPLWMRQQRSWTWEAVARDRLSHQALGIETLERCVGLLLSMEEAPAAADVLIEHAVRSGLYGRVGASLVRADLRRLVAARLVQSNGRIYMPNFDLVRAWPVPV